MADSSTERPRVFISYSHADKVHLKRLQVHLEPYVRARLFEVWDDTHIQPGDHWKTEIEQAIASATVAIFLISADFFASKFIDAAELPPLLEAAGTNGTRILPVIVGTSDFSVLELGQLQAVNPPSRPLKKLKPDERDAVWVRVVNAIKNALPSKMPHGASPHTPSATNNPPAEQKAPALPPSWSEARLPMTASLEPLEEVTVQLNPDMLQPDRVSVASATDAPLVLASDIDRDIDEKPTILIAAIAVRQGKEIRRIYEILKDTIRIGRSRESDIFLEDLAVSRLHATIYRDEGGRYFLRDEHSANGTSVNGQRIMEVELNVGDLIQLGSTILAFVNY